jgi:hypothetical protein
VRAWQAWADGGDGADGAAPALPAASPAAPGVGAPSAAVRARLAAGLLAGEACGAALAGWQLPLRLLLQLRLAVAALDPFRLMRFVKHAALDDRLFEQGHQCLRGAERAAAIG